MKFMSGLLAAAAVAGFSSAAISADLIVQDPIAMAVPSADWSGFYVGGHVGYGAGVMNLSAPFIDADDEAQDVAGYLGGLQLGYNMQMDSVLFGLQTDLSLSGIASDEDGGGEDDTIDWLGSTTARVGIVADSFVPYLKGGVAYGGGTGDAAGESISKTQFGWTVGAGLEFALTDSISVFGEYDYYNFGSTTYEFAVGDVDVDTDLHVIKTGLNFRF